MMNKIKTMILYVLLLLIRVKAIRFFLRKLLGTVAGVYMLAGLAGVAQAGNLESVLRNDNILVLPQVRVGDERYFLRMNMEDAATYTFTLDASSIMKITRPETAGEDVNVAKTDIVGTWTHEDEGVENLNIRFGDDETYEIFENFDGEGCLVGSETGLYDWEISTGLLRVATLTDENGECGISNVAPFLNAPLRVFTQGDTMKILDPGQNYEDEGFVFLRVTE